MKIAVAAMGNTVAGHFRMPASITATGSGAFPKPSQTK